MTKERLLEFLEKYVFSKYKDHLIILDNAGSHNNELIKNAITNSGNHYLFAVPYTPNTDEIEQYFNQIKTYMKKDRNVGNYQQLEHNVDKAIEKVKKENYKNYFEYAYNLKEGYELKGKSSTRRRKLKIYK
jgi:transposase